MIVNHCVHAYAETYETISGDSTFHTLAMDTTLVDSDSYHDDTVNNSRLTFTDGGVHLVFGAPAFNNPGAGVRGRLTKNGTSVGYEYAVDGFAAGPTSISGPLLFWIDDFAAGDYMESQGWNDAGGSKSAWTQMCALEVDDYSCMVGDTSSTAAGTYTFANVLYDPHGMATATDRITVQKAGYYLCLFNQNGGVDGYFEKNSSGVMLNGSFWFGTNRAAADYAVDWFEVGDYVQCKRINGTIDYRQFAMVYLGDSDSCLGYTYNAVDINNTDAGFDNTIRTEDEYIDTCDGHPQGGYVYNPSPVYCTTCGSFNMLTGYHFALAKISTDGGTFFQNDGVYTSLNGAQLGNIFSQNRHSRPTSGNGPTTIAFACFEATFGDTFIGSWLSSNTYVETAFAPFTNVFVTDTAEFPPPEPQAAAYQRMYGWRASIDDNALETVEVFTSPQGFTS